MAAKTILAVAIGDPTISYDIATSTDGNISRARPYIQGLIDRLSDRNSKPPKKKGEDSYTIGTNADYVIHYRERRTDAELDTLFQAQGPGAHLIFCMSTTVARRADYFTRNTAGQGSKPIVAVVSDPKRENFGVNVCGVSAMRSQTAGECLEEFRERVGNNLTKVYILHRDQYDPSNDAKFWMQDDPNIVMLSIPQGADDNTIANTIGTQVAAPAGQTYGILVLPADRFFAAREAIFTAANNKGFPTFWSVTDFNGAGKAFGGYGVSQKDTGRYMASQVDKIWDSGVVPNNPRWVVIRKEDFKSSISLAAAKALKVKLKGSRAASKTKSKKSEKKPRGSKKR